MRVAVGSQWWLDICHERKTPFRGENSDGPVATTGSRMIAPTRLNLPAGIRNKKALLTAR